MPSNRASRDRRKRPVIYLRLLSTDRTKAYGLSTGNALATPIEFTNAVTQREQ